MTLKQVGSVIFGSDGTDIHEHSPVNAATTVGYPGRLSYRRQDAYAAAFTTTKSWNPLRQVQRGRVMSTVSDSGTGKMSAPRH